MPLIPYLHRVVSHESLTQDDACAAMGVILEGRASTAQIAALLVGLRMKGETVNEIAGFAKAMREKAIFIDPGTVSAAEPLLDTAGTGGDGGRTFNVSTVAAFVIAGAGLRVAKHGNRSLSSQCGSADVLEQLGVNVTAGAETASRALKSIGIAFLFAPLIHPAMKHAQPARAELKLRTAFNLLGPLVNPARANRQLIGAPSPETAQLMAEALAQLGGVDAFVVHGSDGLDEVTVTGETQVWHVCSGEVKRLSWFPHDFGMKRSSLADLEGGDRSTNAEIADAILRGSPGPRRDIVLANAAAALLIAGRAVSLSSGVRLAGEAIDSGRATRKLKDLIDFLR
jgi:anthranilate phosphoribosyltransferase